MFGLFGKKDPRKKLEKEHKRLIAESYRLSTSNRAESDRLAAKADAIARQLDNLKP